MEYTPVCFNVGAAFTCFNRTCRIGAYVSDSQRCKRIYDSFTPVFLAFWYKNEISYDGEEIQIKNVFRKKTINLHEIKKLDYDIHVYAIRGGGSCFELMIWRDEIMSDEYDYISLFETADSQSFRDIAKGDHSAINLLMLYDDIIAANPEKKKEKEENKEVENEDDDSQDII